MQLRLAITLTLCLSLATARANASARECAKVAQDGQTSRDDHKLLAARAAFVSCSLPECPSFVQKDCSSWLKDVEARLPSVVLSATEADGGPLFDVTVTADGEPLTRRLDGEPYALDPGPHTLLFEAADGRHTTLEVALPEAEKRRVLSVVFTALPKKPPPEPLHDAPAPLRRSSAWVTTGLVVGGLGVVGLAVGSVFGAIAVSDKAKAQCDGHNICDNPGPMAGVEPAATKSTIGIVAGSALVAGGAALLFFAPRTAHTPRNALMIAPVIGPSHAELLIGGAF